MNHKIEMVLLVFFLMGSIALVGIIIGQANGQSEFFSNLRQNIVTSGTITGGTVADTQDCSGENCPPLTSAARPCAGNQGYACRIVCSVDEDCDDKILQTIDRCKNPGTEYSVCINKGNTLAS